MACTNFPSTDLVIDVTEHVVGDVVYIYKGNDIWESDGPPIDLINDLSQAFEFDTSVLMVDSFTVYPNKKRINVKERSVGEGGGGSYDVISTGTTAGVDLPNGTDILQSTANPSISFKLRVDKSKYLNVKALGAGAFASAAFNVAAMQRACTIADLIAWPDEVYSVDSTIGNNIKLTNATTGGGKSLFFVGNAELVSTTNADTDYRVLWLDQVDNINIYGGIFRGDKDTHTGVTGEGGHAIGCYGVTGLNIYSSQGHDTWGVGLALVDCNDVYCEKVWCDNGRQNSAAIVSGTNILLEGCRFTNASGTAPEAGIDIEPNVAADRIENIRLNNTYTQGNAGAGIQISILPLTNSGDRVEIAITNHIDKESGIGFWVSQVNESTSGTISGSINYINGTIFDTEKAGILVSNYASQKTPKIFIDHPTIYRPNNSGSALVFDSAGIAFDRAVAFTNTNKLGNIHVKNPVIIDDRAVPKMVNCINISDFKNVGYENCVIEDPLQLEGFSSGDINDVFRINQGVVFTDKFNSISSVVTTSKALSAFAAYGLFKNTGAAGLVTFNLPGSFGADTNLTEIKFIDDTGTGIRLEPLAGRNILPLSPVTDKYIQSTQQGASIIIQKRDDNTWYIKEIIGTWTVEP
tara:strand:+ start:5058 stop:6962 length:1905 start_codon:yes stop_codon:yes gene_type:complete